MDTKEHLWLGSAESPEPVWNVVRGVGGGGGARLGLGEPRRACGMDWTCSGSSSGLWRRRWQRGDPRESGRRKMPETLRGSWALASCGGPGEDSAGWPSSSRGAGSRTSGLLFLAPVSDSCFRVQPSPRAVWEDRAANPWLCFPGALAGRLSSDSLGVSQPRQGRLLCRLRLGVSSALLL